MKQTVASTSKPGQPAWFWQSATQSLPFAPSTFAALPMFPIQMSQMSELPRMLMMRRIALRLALGALAAHGTGCVIETTDRPGGGRDPGNDTVAAISARWALRNMRDGAATACPAGFDTAQLYAQPLDDNGAATGELAVDLFECDARTGESTELAPGVYQIWLEIRSHDLAGLYAQSLSQILDVTKLNQVFATDILNDGGYFQLAWDLAGSATDRTVDCAELASPSEVHLISVNVADAQRVYEDQLPCQDHTAVTGGFLQGTYTIAIDARAGDMSVGATTMLTAQMIAGQNDITDLGRITIPVDGL